MTEKIKKLILKNSLKNVVFDGWTDEMFEIAVEESNINYLEAKKIFPRKAIDVAIYFHSEDDIKLNCISEDEFSNLKVRTKIIELIFKRIMIANQNKEAVKRSLALFSLPFFVIDSKKMIYNTSNTIWNIVEDSNKSFSYYSKRISLMYIYSTSLLYWISDETKDCEDTYSFIERSIEKFLKLEEFKRNFSSYTKFDNFKT
tara:strand:+ start:28 stop:630 length:603 start_codon:yes stop_codon:yes gene_type:complete